LKFLRLKLPLRSDYQEIEDIATSFAKEIPTLKYLEIEKGQDRGIAWTGWWRVDVKKARMTETGQEVSGDDGVRLTEIAEGDGVNARDFFDFDWEWPATS
jgi:hypothetical protein